LELKIKAQKISTEGKAKVQLQVVLHDDSSSTFHFVSPQGPEQQVKDRDQVKDLLSNLLPKFRQKISKELEEKKRYETIKRISQRALFFINEQFVQNSNRKSGNLSAIQRTCGKSNSNGRRFLEKLCRRNKEKNYYFYTRCLF
jgi:hypothetical protein